MKRWIAWVLTLILCMMPLLACAQSISTEEMLGQLLARLMQQVKSPSLGITFENGKDMIDACLALDEQNIPDFTFGMLSGSEEIRMDIDKQGFRYQDGDQRFAVAIDTMMRIMAQDEYAGLMTVNLREEDLLLFEQVVFDILGASLVCVSAEVIGSDAQEMDADLLQSEQTEKTRMTLDLNRLLAELDHAIPQTLNRYADELDAWVERNRPIISEVLNGDLGEMREIAQNWPAGLLAGLIPEGIKARIELEMQEENLTFTAYRNETVVARIVYVPGRLYGLFGSNAEYAFDSDDLKLLAQMVYDVTKYVSEDALMCRMQQQDMAMTLHLKLDSKRLIDDLVTGVMAVVRENRAEIENLYARYMPWLHLAGISHAEELNWEEFYHSLKYQLEWDAKMDSEYIRWGVRKNPILRQIFGGVMPEFEMDLYVQDRYIGGPEIIWSFVTPNVNAEFLVSNSILKGSYHVIGLVGSWEYGYVNGFISENESQIVIGHQRSGETDLVLTIDVQQDKNGWHARVYDMNGAEVAKLNGSNTSLNLTMNQGTNTLIGQLYAYDGLWRAKIYANGEELTAMYGDEHNSSLLQILHRKESDRSSKELTLRSGAESLSLYAGTMVGGGVKTGIDLDMQWSNQIPRMNALIYTQFDKLTAAYLPGKLDICLNDRKNTWDWEMHVEDMTSQSMSGNETRVEIQHKKTVDGKQKSSKSGWTIHTQPGTKQWFTQIVGDDQQNMTLMLDFAASPKKQDLTGFTWLTGAQTKQMLDKAMAGPTPVPTVVPKSTIIPVRFPEPTPTLLPIATAAPRVTIGSNFHVTGFQKMEIAIEVDDQGKILSFDVVEHNETPGFGADLIEAGFDELIGQDIATAQIDVKSGVTLTSNAINDALKAAVH